MSDPRVNIETLRDRIQDSSEITNEDREALLEFSDTLYLLKSEYTDHRHEKLLRHCTRISEEVGELAKARRNRDSAEEIVRWINQTYDNEYTNHDYRTALRIFARRTTEGDEIPETVAWVPSGTSNSYDPVPDPADMLKWEKDVIPMIEEARNSRDAALIAVAFDAGARSGELQALKVGDVSDAKHGLRIFVDGKKGQRSVILIPSVPYLQRWLNDHPGEEESDAPLWSKLSEPEELTYRRFRSIFDDVADRAGVTKPVTPTNFRKSNASYLAKRGLNQAFIEDRQGRKRGSDATAHYVARFGGEAEKEYARMQGVEIEEDESEPLSSIKCPRCGRKTPRHEPTCVWCNQAIDHAGVKELEDQEQEVRDALFRFANEKPEIIDDLRRARDFTDLIKENPDLFADAQSFVDALSE